MFQNTDLKVGAWSAPYLYKLLVSVLLLEPVGTEKLNMIKIVTSVHQHFFLFPQTQFLRWFPFSTSSYLLPSYLIHTALICFQLLQFRKSWFDYKNFETRNITIFSNICTLNRSFWNGNYLTLGTESQMVET